MKKALAVLVIVGAAAVTCSGFAVTDAVVVGLAVFAEMGLAVVLAIAVIAQKEA